MWSHVYTVLCMCIVSVLYCVHAVGLYCVVCALYIFHAVCVYHVANPYRVSYAYATLYACIMLHVSTVFCVHLWLRPPTGPDIGISAHIFYLLTPQTCCIPASCQHLYVGTRAATLLVMEWEKLQTTTLPTTEFSSGECLYQHWEFWSLSQALRRKLGTGGGGDGSFSQFPAPSIYEKGLQEATAAPESLFQANWKDWSPSPQRLRAAQGLALAPELGYGMNVWGALPKMSPLRSLEGVTVLIVRGRSLEGCRIPKILPGSERDEGER